VRPAPTFAIAGARGAPGDGPRGRRRLDLYEIALLLCFGAFSLVVVGLDVWHAAADGLVWTGTDGYFIVDQMQYLAWIQSASHHLLISNLFVLRPTIADYFQPAIVISAGVTALGIAPWLALLLWKPVAVSGIFLATRAVVNRTIDGRGARRAALTLGLLFGSFSVVYGGFGIVGDMMSTWLSWGYPFGLMAVSLIVFGLLRYDRARSAGRPDPVPGLLGALAATLHPWQAETMIVVIAGAELVRWREAVDWWRTAQRRRLALPVMTVALAATPLVYYAVLGHVDISWTLARVASKHTFSFWSIAIGIGPLAVFSLLGYRGPARGFLDLVLRVWMPAAIVIYLVSASGFSATPLHAFDGITIPLAILAVNGVRRSRLTRIPRPRMLAVAAIVLGVVPANAYAIVTAHEFVDPTPGNANFITRDERAALSYLGRDRLPGGVLSSFYLGEVIPGRTGRHAYLGDCLWSEPRCVPRAEIVSSVLDGTMPIAASRRFVVQTGARFLLVGCEPRVNIGRRLRPLIASTRRFGCAALFTLRPEP